MTSPTTRVCLPITPGFRLRLVEIIYGKPGKAKGKYYSNNITRRLAAIEIWHRVAILVAVFVMVT